METLLVTYLERASDRASEQVSDVNEIKLGEDAAAAAAAHFGEGGSRDARPAREREGIPSEQTDSVTT